MKPTKDSSKRKLVLVQITPLEDLRVVNVQGASSITGLAAQTLANLRFKGEAPAYFKVGSSIRYRVSELVAFMEERRVKPRVA